MRRVAIFAAVFPFVLVLLLVALGLAGLPSEATRVWAAIGALVLVGLFALR